MTADERGATTAGAFVGVGARSESEGLSWGAGEGAIAIAVLIVMLWPQKDEKESQNQGAAKLIWRGREAFQILASVVGGKRERCEAGRRPAWHARLGR